VQLLHGPRVVVKNDITYIGNMKAREGTTLVDVKDPKHPKILSTLHIAVGTHSHKVRRRRHGDQPGSHPFQKGFGRLKVAVVMANISQIDGRALRRNLQRRWPLESRGSRVRLGVNAPGLLLRAKDLRKIPLFRPIPYSA
jgi:hypothetical protein